MTLFIAVMVAAVGQAQCQMINGRQVCSTPASISGFDSMPFAPQFSAPDYYSRPIYPAPTAAPTYPIYESIQYSGDGFAIVPGSVRYVSAVRPARDVIQNVPRTVAPAPRRVIGGGTPRVRGERPPTATPGPAIPERERIEPAPEPEDPGVPGKAPGVPQERPAATGVGQLSPSPVDASAGRIRLPGGGTAELPKDTAKPVHGLPKPTTPDIRAKDGKVLPTWATGGMLWKPGTKGGYQTDSPQGKRFVESLKVGAPTEFEDDSGRLRVTIISEDPEARKLALQDYKTGAGVLAPYRSTYLARGSSPEDWDVKGIGLSQIKQVAGGKPGVVIQEASGRVLFAANHHDPKSAVEVLRKANPKFDPDKVPGEDESPGPIGMTTRDTWMICGIAATVLVLMMARRPPPDGTAIA